MYLELVGTWNPGNPAVVSVPTLDGTRPKALKGLRGGRVLGFEWNWLGIGWDSGKGQESRPASLPAEGKPHKSYCFSTSLSFKSAHENPGDGRKKCFRLWFHFTHPSSFFPPPPLAPPAGHAFSLAVRRFEGQVLRLELSPGHYGSSRHCPRRALCCHTAAVTIKCVYGGLLSFHPSHLIRFGLSWGYSAFCKHFIGRFLR